MLFQWFQPDSDNLFNPYKHAKYYIFHRLKIQVSQWPSSRGPLYFHFHMYDTGEELQSCLKVNEASSSISMPLMIQNWMAGRHYIVAWKLCLFKQPHRYEVNIQSRRSGRHSRAAWKRAEVSSFHVVPNSFSFQQSLHLAYTNGLLMVETTLTTILPLICNLIFCRLWRMLFFKDWLHIFLSCACGNCHITIDWTIDPWKVWKFIW